MSSAATLVLYRYHSADAFRIICVGRMFKRVFQPVTQRQNGAYMRHCYLNKETLMKGIFLLAACASILAVALICLFLFANGLPAIGKIGIFDFLLGKVWKPGNDLYGILPMILGSI